MACYLHVFLHTVSNTGSIHAQPLSSRKKKVNNLSYKSYVDIQYACIRREYSCTSKIMHVVACIHAGKFSICAITDSNHAHLR